MEHIRLEATPERQLHVRLATTLADIAAAQSLRYRIFVEEMGATPSRQARAARRDIDNYDHLCDHLLVEDLAGREARVVGTYRLLRQSVALAHGGFYASGEFDLARLVDHALGTGFGIVELGRSCVEPAYRDSRTIQLLWRGIADYLQRGRVGFLIGCASFPGTDPRVHADALAYLRDHHLAASELRATAYPKMRASVSLPSAGQYDPRLAARSLPPLIKGYLRVGAMVGDGAFIDRSFNTVDVFMVMPVERIAARYAERFSVAA